MSKVTRKTKSYKIRDSGNPPLSPGGCANGTAGSFPASNLVSHIPPFFDSPLHIALFAIIIA